MILRALPTPDEDLVERAIANLESAIAHLRESPEDIHGGGVLILFFGERHERAAGDIHRYQEYFYSTNSILKMIGALNWASHAALHEGARQ